MFVCVVLGGLKVTCEYLAQQEGVLCEEVLLLSETNDDVCVRVKVHARVMGEVSFHAMSNKHVHCTAPPVKMILSAAEMKPGVYC